MEPIIYLFITFVTVNLAVGLYYSRGIKTFKAYAVGEGSMHPWLLAATIAATWATGSGFAAKIKEGFSYDIHAMMTGLFIALALFFVSCFVLRMGEFYGTTSIAGAMGRLYGRRVALVTAAGSFMCCAGKLACQLRIFSDVVASTLGLNPTVILLTLSTLMILYSVWGGIRAIVFTDLLQFVIMGLGMPIVLYLLYGYGGNIAPSAYISENHGTISTFAKDVWQEFYSGFGKYSYFLMMGFVPPLVQRCLVNRDLLQTRKAFRWATLGYAYIAILIILLGQMLATNPIGLDKDDLLASMIKKYSYTAFKTSIACVIMAMALSSTDSYINTAAILLSELSHKKSLFSVRWFGVLTGVLSVGIAFFTQDRGLIAISWASFLFYAPVVPVFLLALLGFRSSSRTALMAMMGGMLVTLGLKFGMSYILPVAISVGSLANVLLMFGIHYGLREPGGWVGIKDKDPLVAHAQLRKRRWASRWASCKNFDLLRYLKHNLPQKEGHYIFFGLYVMTFIFGGTFFLPQELIQEESMTWILGSFLLLNSITMTYPLWPQEVKRPWIIAPLWALNLGYALCYIGMLYLLLGGFQMVYVVLLVVNLVVGMLVFRHKLMLTCLTLGSLMAILTCRTMGHDIHLANIEPTWTQISFALTVTLAGLWSLYASQQARRRLVRHYHTLDRLQRSTEETLTALQLAPDHFAKQIVDTNHAGIDEAYAMSKERMGENDELTKQLHTSSQYLAKILQLIQHQTRMEQQVCPLPKFLNQLYDRYPDRDEAGLILYNRANNTTIQWDLRKMHQLLYKTYRYLKRHHPKVTYSYLHVQKTHLKYPGYPKSIPAVAFALTFTTHRPPIAANYTHTERVDDPYLIGNQKLRELHTLTDKHYGHLDLNQAPQTVLIVLPLRLDKIRPKVIEDQLAPDKALQSELLRQAKASEISFWSEILPKAHYNIPEIEQAVYFMKAAHQHQTRKNKAPYYTHTLTVAKYTSQQDDRPHLLIAALLHDIVEDTHVTLEEVHLRFGDQIAQLVKLLSNTKLNSFKKYKEMDKKTHTTRLAHNRDAILLKACDRRHNLETLHAMPHTKKQAKAKETLTYYVPAVRTAGFPDLADQLEEMAKRFL